MTPFLWALSAFAFGGVGAVVLARSAKASSFVAMLGATAGCAIGGWVALRALLGGDVVELALPWSTLGGLTRIDALSAFFLLPLFVVGAAGAVYGRGYLLGYADRRSLVVPWVAFNVFLASMALVVVARHAILFLVAWETMSISAYALVTFEHEQASVRRAGWIYLVATHLGVVFLIAMFLLLARETGDFRLTPLLTSSAKEPRVALLFLLALVGFGAKAGLVPLHVWLPEAHAAAPSHMSALMSAVMVKMGVYGILRVSILLGGPAWWWGPLLMLLGLTGAVLGIAFALYQRDLKRVLAYSTVENVGLIALGLGVGFWGASSGQLSVAGLGLTGALLHVWNHAAMKGLMFLGAGSVLHGSRSKDLERLGGLMRRMPVTSSVMMLGAVAIAGLPPLNAFVGEWLLYMGLFRGALGLRGAGSIAMLVAMAVVALVGALAVLCFVRVVGIGLLGEPRSPDAERAHESSASLTIPMGVLALVVLGLALAPGVTTGPLGHVVAELLGRAGDAREAMRQVDLAGLGAVNATILAILVVVGAIARGLWPSEKVARDTTWGCGYVAPTARMQYTAQSFSELFTSQVLPHRLAPRRSVHAPQGIFPSPGRSDSDTSDPLTRGVYEPFFSRWADRVVRLRWMQQGQLSIYIVYILVMLLAALAWSVVQGPGRL